VSGLSNVSESDRKHLRGISETSVSTNNDLPFVTPLETPGRGLGIASEGGPNAASERGEGAASYTGIPPPVPDPPIRATAVSPLTPPQGLEGARDYLGAKNGSSAEKEGVNRRRSNFSEELGDDAGKS